jgi:hypothetical protein
MNKFIVLIKRSTKNSLIRRLVRIKSVSKIEMLGAYDKDGFYDRVSIDTSQSRDELIKLCTNDKYITFADVIAVDEDEKQIAGVI